MPKPPPDPELTAELRELLRHPERVERELLDELADIDDETAERLGLNEEER